MSSLPTPAACPRCAGSGWIPLSGDSLRVEPCACQGDLRRRQRIAAANIPRRYVTCRIKNFNDRESVLKSAKTRVEQFVNEWMPQFGVKGLLLQGGCGTGKTHLAVAALQEIIQSDKPGKLLFSNFQDLIQEIQATFDPESPIDKSELLRPLLEADLLVLDELGSQKPSNFVHDILYYIINSRYNGMRTTIFTTNNVEDLGDRIGDRLRSRLYEMASVIHLTGIDDYRRKKI
ncbi:MAG: ATP-binding protein [Acidobacteriota bacterium]